MPIFGRSTGPQRAPATVSFAWNAYRSGDSASWSRPRSATSAPRGLIWCHGSGATSLHWTVADDLAFYAEVLGRGCGQWALVAGDFGGMGTYGNQSAVDAVAECIAWAQGAGIIAAGKVALLGHSMGGCTMVNFAARNPSSVAGMVMLDGGVNLSGWAEDGIPGYQTAEFVRGELDDAYAPSDWASNEATRCPRLVAAANADLRAIPLLHYLAGDGSAGDGIKVVPEADADLFEDAYGPNCTTIRPSATCDHGQIPRWVPAADVAGFLAGLTW